VNLRKLSIVVLAYLGSATVGMTTPAINCDPNHPEYELLENFEPIEPTERMLPAYPLAADGTPQGVAAFSDDHPRSLEASAIEALEQFIYAPQMRDGQPVAVEGVRFCFDFRISR